MNTINENQQNYSFKSSCFEWMEAIIISIITVAILFSFVFRAVTIVGSSMENTLLDKDKVIITDFMYKPNNGDIIVATSKTFSDPIIKRVIAKGGQTLKINFSTGDVYVDGQLLNEPYIKTATVNYEGAEIPEVIPEGYLFVMGDNRLHSKDSRSPQIGLIDEDDIMGKAQFIIYPFSRIGGLY